MGEYESDSRKRGVLGEGPAAFGGGALIELILRSPAQNLPVHSPANS